MSNKTNNCPVHGDKLANEVHNYSAKKAELLGHPEMTVDRRLRDPYRIRNPFHRQTAQSTRRQQMQRRRDYLLLT